MDMVRAKAELAATAINMVLGTQFRSSLVSSIVDLSAMIGEAGTSHIHVSDSVAVVQW